MSNTTGIDDETYAKLSNAAYTNIGEGFQPVDLDGWVVLEKPADGVFSGFDAVTFYNASINQAVIAYRGTEGQAGWVHSVPDFLNDIQIGMPELGRKLSQSLDVTPEWLDNKISNFNDFTGITKADEWVGKIAKDVDKSPLLRGKTNQLYLAEDYAKEMQNKYKDYNFSLTGHSLGGANAQYAAAYTGISAVTFSAPSVISSLTPDARRKAEAGEFDRQIINYAHPGDIVASGTMGGYDRHVGSTYYIDSNYTEANEGVSLWGKVSNSFGGANYHSLDRYSFDDGYLANDIFDASNGERVGESPRMPSDINVMDEISDFILGLSNSVAPLLKKHGVFASTTAALKTGTIQVSPNELRHVANRWKTNAHRAHGELGNIQTLFSQYIQSSRSRRLQPMVEQLLMSITTLSQYYLQKTNDILYYINIKADQFENVDNNG
ncbi:lipase family protein [Paenibacillus lautus]|uniref:lipase family protein n=1 Tax=Paenibacillus lautus TaxID=1401 RepID=UPI003D2CDF23